MSGDPEDEDFDCDPMTPEEKKDERALKAQLKHWASFGWDTQAIALGWYLARGYERRRARELVDLSKL